MNWGLILKLYLNTFSIWRNMRWEWSHFYLAAIYILCNHDVTQAPFLQVYVYICVHILLCAVLTFATHGLLFFRTLEKANCRKFKDVEGDSFVNRSANVPVLCLASSPKMKKLFASHPSAAESFWTDLPCTHLQNVNFKSFHVNRTNETDLWPPQSACT